MAGRAGRAPVLMKIASASQRPHATCLERHFDDLGSCEAALTEDELDVLGLLQPTLPPRSEVVHDCLLALADLRQVHGHRTTAHTVLGGAPGQVGDAGTGDHGLGWRASHVDASAANVLPFDDGGPATGPPQVQGQRFSRLAGAQDDRVKTLRLHDNASTTKKSCAVVTLSAGRNRFSFYALIAGDEPRSRQGREEVCCTKGSAKPVDHRVVRHTLVRFGLIDRRTQEGSSRLHALSVRLSPSTRERLQDSYPDTVF